MVELQGALFFGSAERLAEIVDRETAAGTGVVILGMRRITEIDSTGARIVSDIDAALARRNVKLALVRSDDTETAARLADVSNATTRIFPDIDHAIEWAEDDLLNKTPAIPADELALDRVSILRDFTAAQIEVLRRHLKPVKWPAGHTIFTQGEPGSELFLVIKGSASVHLTTEGANIRLITFAPGSVFGELAILDHGRRAATVTADEDMKAFALSGAAFGELGEREPGVAIKLLTALGQELSDRLRCANRTIHQLEM